MHDDRGSSCSTFSCPLNRLASCLCAERPALHLKAGRTLCHQGDPLERVFILCRGLARQVRHSSHGDQHLWLAFVEPGTVLGYHEVLTGRPRWGSSIEVLEDCRFVALEPEAFLRLLQGSAGFAFRLLHQSLRQERGLQRQCSRLFHQTACEPATPPLEGRT